MTGLEDLTKFDNISALVDESQVDTTTPLRKK